MAFPSSWWGGSGHSVAPEILALGSGLELWEGQLGSWVELEEDKQAGREPK